MTEFKLPELGENVESGDVISVLVSVGDTVEIDQPVLELETDKATIEVPSSVSGVVKEIHVKDGDEAKVGQTILTLDGGESNGASERGDGAEADTESEPEPEPEPKKEPEPATGKSAPAESKGSGPVEFKVPELGENVESGDVVSVLVSVGETIEKEQPVLELETDKATIEVPSSVSGTVKEINVAEGDTVEVGHVILTVEGAGEAAAAAEPEPEPATASEPEPAPAAEEEEEEAAAAESGPVEFKLPELGENVESGDVVSVLVSAGDSIEKDQPVLELETDKATLEVPSAVSGTITAINVKDGDTVKVGQVILTVEGAGAAPAQPEQKPQEKEEAKPTPTPEAKTAPTQSERPRTPQPTPTYVPPTERKPKQVAPAAPSVRRLARELGVDINQIPGSGPAGRISQKDVKSYVKNINLERQAEPDKPAAGGMAIETPPLPDFTKWGDVERERMNAVRRATAKQMHVAWSNIPHVTNFDKADITELEKLRKQFGQRAEAAGGKLTVTAILIKVLAAALKQFPKFNASLDLENEEVVFKKYYHIGVAVDTERGLFVPSIRDVDKKNIIELAVELTEIGQKARDRKLTMEDLQGSSFTITNLGGIGGTNFTPIVNHPEVAILGVARGNREAVYIDGKFEPRMMMPLALSYDHRLIDGADAARFLRWVAAALEQPFLLALEG